MGGTMRAVSTWAGAAGARTGCALLVALAVGCGRGEVAAEEGEPSGFARPEPQEAAEPVAVAPAPAAEPEPEPEPEPVVEPPAAEPPAEAAAPSVDPRAELEHRAEALAAGGDAHGAARLYSRLMLSEVSGPGPADRAALARWTEAIDEVQARHRWNARGDWPSIEARVQPGDSLIAVRKRVLTAEPDLLICTGLISRANQLRSETSIRADDTLRVPTEPVRVLVDLSSRWVFYLFGDEVAAAWEVGVGQEGSETTPGSYTVGLKQKDPAWHPEGREMVPFGDPENPLGTRWLAWYDENGRNTSLGFHGTNDESGVGGRVSKGCIRMRNADVEALFEILPLGAPVEVQD